MDSIDAAHNSPEFYMRRKSISRLKDNKPLFEQLMGMTNQCMRKNPHLEGDVSGAIACEHIDPAVMSNLNDYTFHTHPNIDIFSLVMFVGAALYIINYIREKKLGTKMIDKVETVSDGITW